MARRSRSPSNSSGGGFRDHRPATPLTDRRVTRAALRAGPYAHSDAAQLPTEPGFGLGDAHAAVRRWICRHGGELVHRVAAKEVLGQRHLDVEWHRPAHRLAPVDAVVTRVRHVTPRVCETPDSRRQFARTAEAALDDLPGSAPARQGPGRGSAAGWGLWPPARLGQVGPPPGVHA